MTDTLVALDLETTGLDPRRDAILEIGAVRFNVSGEILERWSTLVNPGCEVPLFIERLTGIRTADLLDAPDTGTALAGLARFTGDSPVVGHNVGFDLAFIRNAAGEAPGPAIDTVEVARCVLPMLPTHALNSVAAAVGVEIGNHHRALNDAEVSARILCKLGELARTMPVEVRAAIAATVPASPPTIELFQLDQMDRTEPRPPDLIDRITSHETAFEPGPSLRPASEEVPVTAEDVLHVFDAGVRMEGFEERKPQQEMSLAVAAAFSGQEQWLIEAGTGVGKSLAYLVPAALYALRNGRRVVVSTNTINLQEQLLKKDIPILRTMLKAAGAIGDDEELRVAVLKGRGNYLCRQRLSAIAAAPPDPTIDRLLAAMLSWLPKTVTGDRGELNLPPNLQPAWSRVSAQDSDCLSRRNKYVGDGSCFVLRARRAAESAHIVIVNHALLLTDMAAGNSVIPGFEHLVIDEAHHLEDVATQQFGTSFTVGSFVDVAGHLGRASQPVTILGRLAALDIPALRQPITTLDQMLSELPEVTTRCFDMMNGLRFPSADDRLTIDDRVRLSPAWHGVEQEWSQVLHLLQAIVARGQELAKVLAAVKMTEAEGDDLREELRDRLTALSERTTECDNLIHGRDDGLIRWVTRRSGRETTMLSGTPLAIGPKLRDEVFGRIPTVVATSATLATGDDMTFSARSMGLDDAETLQLPSPFDYEGQVLLGLITDVESPQARGFNESVAAAIEELALAAGGRGLVLCTSRAMVDDLRSRLREPLEREGIVVVAQGQDGSPRQVVETLRRDPRTLVIGTSSLWEGVDVAGDALSLVIIPKLPFAVPSDPIQQARGGQYRSPFREFSLPSAVLRFRQGFGRLVRTPDDFGAVVILDRRVIDKGYGRTFLNSLPGFTLSRGVADDVAGQIADWLNR